MPQHRLITHKDRKTIYCFAEVFNILYERFGIELFAIGGTLLGAVRNQDIIEWDDDIDYGIRTTNMSRLGDSDVLGLLNDMGYVLFRKDAVRYDYIWHLFKTDSRHRQNDILRMTHRDRHAIMNMQHDFINPENCIFADIFGYEPYGGRNFLKRNGSFVQPVDDSQLNSGLVRYEFGGTHIYSISEPEKYLTETYGPNWRTPRFRQAHRRADQRFTTFDNIYVIGTFDILHSGHFNLLYRSKTRGSRLIVGICSDRLVERTKGRRCLFDQDTRNELICRLDIVDRTIVYDDLDHSTTLISENIDVFVVPPEYGYADGHTSSLRLCERVGIKVIRSERTEGVSSTLLREIMLR